MPPVPSDLEKDLLLKVARYLRQRNWDDVPVMAGHRFTVSPLARGEYNFNYRISAQDASLELVFRVNRGTQIQRNDQVLYEYRALDLLKDTGVTPVPHFVDDTRSRLEYGILIMEYLPGEPLDYTRDLEDAARLLAVIHQVKAPEARNTLIREEAPLSLIYEECAGLLGTYFDSDLADDGIRSYLRDLLHWAHEAKAKEVYYQEDPWPCIVNTEVNSGNFIVNRKKKTLHLVDWEMPRWGDPSQDLSHFCSPLTTLWKSAFRMTGPSKQAFIDAYARHINDRHLRDTLGERIALRDPFVYLRGISWSAMAWVAYQGQFAGIKNPDTWHTLQRYMDLAFIRSLFDPILKL